MTPSARTALAASTLLLLAAGLAGCMAEVGDDEHPSEDEVSALFEQAFAEEQDEGKADGPGCSGVRVPDRGGFGKHVALTFDDGPNPATTPTVLEILRRHGIPATFFVNGSRVTSEATRAIVRDVASDPMFIVGNHTQSHKNMATLSSGEVARQIDLTTDVLREAGQAPRYFRFPFGSSTCSTAQAVRSRGYVITGWHVDSADWCYASGNGYCAPRTFGEVPSDLRRDMPSYVLGQIRARQGGIVLFHDIHGFTARAIEGIIETLLAEGYTFVGLDDTTVFPALNGESAPAPTPAPPAAFVGTRCSSDADCAFTVSGRTGFCQAAGFCSLSCEGTCPDRTGAAPTFCVADPAAADRGMCVSKAHALNMSCGALPGTHPTSAERFLGTSSSRPATAEVCLP